ncbi:hypothetical protein [Rhizobium sp. FKY42]|uniref:hypothetical protein n=1 Tax=Rhizobium sp. FKY42 TaxID=2562310 RepID=UPI0010C0E79C|nr:hypothetical protein [Rhizobium sp. FKY42]
MSDKNEPNPVSIQRRQPTEAEVRRARAAQKLRENLQRRKQQARARRDGEADLTDGLPAAKPHQSDD